LNGLILASSSPRRKELLAQLGLKFDVITSQVDESQITFTAPEQLVMELALLKARSVVATSFSSVIVIGADTVVAVDADILGKPTDPTDATRMLKRLTGRQHQVYTGIALIEVRHGEINKIKTGYRRTEVWMKPLSDEEIAWYVGTGVPMDKAGSYGIQALGACFIERIDGCYFNVVGLSLSLLNTLMDQLGYDLKTGYTSKGG
jgi:septum formation protein